MSALMTLQAAHLAYGHVALLNNAEMRLDRGERLGLIGRNGTGKSSLLKILAGIEQPDAGGLQRQQGLRWVYVPQEPSFAEVDTLFDAVARGLAPLRALREDYERIACGDIGEAEAKALENLQTQIEALDGWTWEQRVQETLERLGLQASVKCSECSGGMLKRAALAEALVQRPDVLLLDEPTNHLDIQAIGWLEGLLTEWGGSLIVISHDRAFLNAVCTGILELDRGVLRRTQGNLEAYERHKAEQLAAEALAFAREDKLLAQEEVWIRKGVEARRTRSVSRIARLEALRQSRAARREQVGQVRMAISRGDISGKVVADLDGVCKTFPGPQPKRIVDNLTTTILRGDKVGLVGPNGAGKTTLLKLILGELSPDSGTVRQGTRCQVAYFDQMREGLNPEATLEDTISPGSEWIEIDGHRQHVRSYLESFLFSPERARSPVRSLSGGERNRLLLARLFARPANVLVLDEPTNDLDIETLELLEELLRSYSGTVFLVSHDRVFLDNVVDSLLVNEAPGLWREVEGTIQDWLRENAHRENAHRENAQRQNAQHAQAAESTQTTPPRGQKVNTQASGQRSTPLLSRAEQRELDGLPAQIDAWEQELAAMADRAGSETSGDLFQEMAALQAKMDAALARWEALEARSNAAA